jgi:hypothetical protein
MQRGNIMTMKEFLTHCTACGGNWTAMMLSGIKKLFPEYWNSLPDDTEFDFSTVMKMLDDLGVK